MAKLSELRIDPEKASSGVWVDYGAGVRLKIARAGSRKAQEVAREIGQANLERLRAGMTPDELEDIDKQIAARAHLVGWESIEDEEGSAIPYSPEQALAFLRDPELDDLWQVVKSVSERARFYRKEAVGNLPAGSSTG